MSHRGSPYTHTHTHTYLLFSHSVTFNFFATQWTVAHQAPPSIDCPGKNTGVGNHFLLHGIFLTQGSNSVSCIGRQILYHWAMREAHIHGCVCVFKVKITHTHTHTPLRGFLGGAVVNNPLANAEDTGDVGSVPESGRPPGVGNDTHSSIFA